MDESFLLSIPDELLLHIARVLEGRSRQKSLYNLALVNRRLSHIVYEELYYRPLIWPRYASQFVSQLLDRPKLVKKVTGLEVLDGNSPSDETSNWDDKHFHFGDVDELSDKYLTLTLKCSRALQAAGINDHSWRWAAGLQDGDPLAYIAVILAITPKLKHLVLSEQYARCLAQPNLTYRNTFGSPSRPYLAKSLDHVSRELQELTIPGAAQDKRLHWTSHSWGLFSVDMTVLKLVKSVTVSFNSISSGHPRVQATGLQLPPNLRSFWITDCEALCIKFLEFFIPCERHKYQQLREIGTVWKEAHLSEVSEIMQRTFQSDLDTVRKAAEILGVTVSWSFPGDGRDCGSLVIENGPTQTS